ncbi:type IV pilus modification protein PilV [Aliikangiella sp. IMCC44653]
MLINLKYQRGVSLVEILVTTLILGIGLLGVAALQVSSLSSNQEGFYTSQATSIAEDFASRIRNAKLASVIPSVTDPNGKYIPSTSYADLLGTYTVDGALECDSEPQAMCGGSSATNCDFADMAIYERWEVCRAAETLLPGGQVRLTNTGSKMTVVVDWDSMSQRSDIGTKKNINASCKALTGSEERNCIIMEIVP